MTKPATEQEQLAALQSAIDAKDPQAAQRAFTKLGAETILATLDPGTAQRLREIPRCVDNFFVALENDEILLALLIVNDATTNELCEIFSQHDMVAGLFGVQVRYELDYAWARLAALLAVGHGLSMDDITYNIALAQPGGYDVVRQSREDAT